MTETIPATQAEQLLPEEEGVHDGIYHGTDDAGNPFFTAAGSPYHLADIRKKQAAQAAEAAEKETKEENPSGESETHPVPEANTPRPAVPNGTGPKENRRGNSQPS
ncbi:hypothetical protein [Corynebacterium matruchotii]|uniref:hypothetical protein n=1 Tax=Corynebacterium matruchotii TaxID=43768 RepID=UPI0028EAE255|nr:hypothetical protein [Corynebacterium matruchotii]